MPHPALSRRALALLVAGFALAPAAGLATEPSQGSNRNEQDSFGRIDLHTPARRLVPRALIVLGADGTRMLDLRAGMARYREDRLDLIDASRLPLIGGLLRAPLRHRFRGAVATGTLHLTRDAILLRSTAELPAPRRIVLAHRAVSWETRRAPQPAPGYDPGPASAAVGDAYRQPDSGEWLLVIRPARIEAAL